MHAVGCEMRLSVVKNRVWRVACFKAASMTLDHRIPTCILVRIRTMQPQQQPISGPRSKCDQVVYEAIAKACEIVVRGRCDVPDPASHGQQNSAVLGASSTAGGAVIVGSDRPVHGIYSPQRGFHRQGGGTAASGSAGSRFNLEVAEVDAVR